METPIKISDPEVERSDMEEEEISVGLETDATRRDVYRSHPKLLFDGIDVLEKSSKRNCELSHLNFIFLAEDNFKWRLSPPLIYSEKSKCFLRTTALKMCKG